MGKREEIIERDWEYDKSGAIKINLVDQYGTWKLEIDTYDARRRWKVGEVKEIKTEIGGS